jgi:hypothetical protein
VVTDVGRVGIADPDFEAVALVRVREAEVVDFDESSVIQPGPHQRFPPAARANVLHGHLFGMVTTVEANERDHLDHSRNREQGEGDHERERARHSEPWMAPEPPPQILEPIRPGHQADYRGSARTSLR